MWPRLLFLLRGPAGLAPNHPKERPNVLIWFPTRFYQRLFVSGAREVVMGLHEAGLPSLALEWEGEGAGTIG